MNFEDVNILDILPQRPPFVFVDRLLHYDEELTVTSFTVPESSFFIRDGKFLTSGLVENMAQSSAARIGYRAKYILHIPVTVGYIGNVKGLKVYRNPSVGEVIDTKVIFREEIFGIVLTDVKVTCGEEIIAEATLKNALSDIRID